jgi:hypothetical protein
MVVAIYDGGRRCDETCYDAHGMSCACGCKGKNHGMGLKRAMANEGLSMTNEEAESIVEARAVNEGDEDVIAQESVAANEAVEDYCPDCGEVLVDGTCPDCDFEDEEEGDGDESEDD